MKTLACSVMVCSLAAILLAGSARCENRNSELGGASAILERVAAVYAGAQTYRDRGMVKTTYTLADRSFSNETPFTTAYRTPNSFRFEFVVPLPDNTKGPERHWIVFRSANEVDQWSFLEPVVSAQASLDLTVAGASGVSSGAAHNIPALLMPNEISGRKLTGDAEAARLLDEAKCGASECFRVQRIIQTERGELTETVWIAKTSFLVQRIDHHTALDNFTVDSTTTYEPLLGEPVSDEALALNIPSTSNTAAR
jgi:hypothetical protein